MNSEWWGLHALRHVYLCSVFHTSHCDWWCPALNESGQILERSVPRPRLNDAWGLLARPDLGHDTGAVGFGICSFRLQGGLVENRFGVRRSWGCSFCGGIRKAHPSSCHSSDGKANRENKPPIQSGTPRIQTLSKTVALIIRRARMCEWSLKKNIEIKLPFISLGRLSIMLSVLWRCSSPLRDSVQEASRLTVECSEIHCVYFSFLIYNLMRDTYSTLSKNKKDRTGQTGP